MAFIALGIVYWRKNARDAMKPASSAQTHASRAVTALGRLEPEGGIMKMGAPSFEAGPAIVERLFVREGDLVAAGDTLAELKSLAVLQSEVAQAAAAAAAAEARLALAANRVSGGEIEALRAEVAGSVAEEEKAGRDARRFGALFETGAVSADEEERQQLALTSAGESVRAAEGRLRQALADRSNEYRVAAAQLAEAKAALEGSRARLAYGVVIAPFSGRVLKVHAHDGEMTGEKGILELGRTERMYAVAEVYESEIGRVRTGQQARVRGEAFAEEMKGVVEFVGGKVGRNEVMGTNPWQDADFRVVRVKIRLSDEDSRRASSLTNLQVIVTIE